MEQLKRPPGRTLPSHGRESIPSGPSYVPKHVGMRRVLRPFHGASKSDMTSDTVGHRFALPCHCVLSLL